MWAGISGSHDLYFAEKKSLRVPTCSLYIFQKLLVSFGTKPGLLSLMLSHQPHTLFLTQSLDFLRHLATQKCFFIALSTSIHPLKTPFNSTFGRGHSFSNFEKFSF